MDVVHVKNNSNTFIRELLWCCFKSSVGTLVKLVDLLCCYQCVGYLLHQFHIWVSFLRRVCVIRLPLVALSRAFVLNLLLYSAQVSLSIHSYDVTIRHNSKLCLKYGKVHRMLKNLIKFSIYKSLHFRFLSRCSFIWL